MTDATDNTPEPTGTAEESALKHPAVPDEAPVDRSGQYEESLRDLTTGILSVAVAILVVGILAGFRIQVISYDTGGTQEVLEHSFEPTLRIAVWSSPFFALWVIGWMIRFALRSVLAALQDAPAGAEVDETR